MADLNIDTTNPNYQQMVTQGLPWLLNQMQNRKLHLLRLSKLGEKAKLQQWLAADPLLADTIDFAAKVTKVADKVRDSVV